MDAANVSPALTVRNIIGKTKIKCPFVCNSEKDNEAEAEYLKECDERGRKVSGTLKGAIECSWTGGISDLEEH